MLQKHSKHIQHAEELHAIFYLPKGLNLLLHLHNLCKRGHFLTVAPK